MVKDEKDRNFRESPPSEGASPEFISGWPQDGLGKDQKILTTISSIPIIRKQSLFLPADKGLRGRAKALRKRGNLPEIVFWQQVHKGKFHNIDFDRQRVIGRYIVDFYIKGLSLVIEIDGSSHNGKEKYDEQRNKY